MIKPSLIFAGLWTAMLTFREVTMALFSEREPQPGARRDSLAAHGKAVILELPLREPSPWSPLWAASSCLPSG